jgi:hypothetical protein
MDLQAFFLKNPLASLFNPLGQNLCFVFFGLLRSSKGSQKDQNFYQTSFSSNGAMLAKARGERPLEGQKRAHHTAQLSRLVVGPIFALEHHLVASFLQDLRIVEK